MNHFKRKLCPSRIAGLAGVFFAVLGGFTTAGGRPLFLLGHPWIWVILVGTTGFALFATYGSDFLRFCLNAFLALFCRTEPNEKYAEIADAGSRYALGTAIMTFVAELLITMANMDAEIIEVGKHMARSLVAVFLGAFLSELFFPFLARIYRTDHKAGTQGSRLPILLGFCVSALLALFMVMWIISIRASPK